jgi:hypothetical protein
VLKLGLAQIWLNPREVCHCYCARNETVDGKTTKIKKIIYLFKMAVATFHLIIKSILR